MGFTRSNTRPELHTCSHVARKKICCRMSSQKQAGYSPEGCGRDQVPHPYSLEQIPGDVDLSLKEDRFPDEMAKIV